MDRLANEYFRKRARQQIQFANYLLPYVEKYRDDSLTLTERELRALPYEDLFELAIAVVNKNLTIESYSATNKGFDYSDKSDAKCSIARKHGKGNFIIDASVTGITAKVGTLRVLVNAFGDFYTFVFPKSSYEHLTYSIEIPFKNYNKPSRSNEWWKYEVNNFEEMCKNFTYGGCNSVFNSYI